MKYAILSDIHCHAHTLFATTGPDGVNSRLRIVLDEIERAGKTLIDEGGSVMIIAGDIFHTRGVIDPEVLNPTRAAFARVMGMGIDILAIPGNHDLKSRDTSELSSAIQNLQQIDISGSSFQVFNEPRISKRLSGSTSDFAFVPWRHSNEELLEDLETLSKLRDPSGVDIFIHAGIDGVLSGVPASGLTSSKLAAFGFRRVFAGHYHNHVDFGDGVFSIGATTHHNWGDVGTRAGFLICDGETGAVKFHATRAPMFVDISGLDEDEMELTCPGNYVRFRGPQMTNDEVDEFRKVLKGWGALGTSIEVPRVTTTARSAAPAKGLTLNESIVKFVDDAETPPHLAKADIARRAQEVLAMTQAVIDEA